MAGPTRPAVAAEESAIARLEVLPASEWARTVAGWLIVRLEQRPDLRVCLPTGDTPSPVYAELVAAEWMENASLAGATVVLLDEWLGLAPGDPGRSDVRLEDDLVGQLQGGVRRFARFAVDGPDGAPLAGAALAAAVAAQDAEAEHLDLVLVGIGGNGHVGFNEPGSTPSSPTRAVELEPTTLEGAVARYGAAARPTGGLTLGLDRILAAGEVWLLVTGEHKAAILREALEGPETSACPASFLRRHPRLTVFADAPAARLLAAPGQA